jgi:hypothetical protein
LNIFKWIALKLAISALDNRKGQLLLDIAKLEAQFEERAKLFAEWSSIHSDHKETISALLSAIQKGK